MVLECPKCFRYIEAEWDFCSSCGVKLNSKDNTLHVYERDEWMKKDGWNPKTMKFENKK